jgi:membrane-associated phospholipid phosphatase
VFRHREDLEERLLRLARTRGHSPAAERTVARFSRLGEHGGIWLAIGLAGALAEPSRRGQWRRAGRAVGAAYLTNTALKLVVRRRRPNLADLPPLTGTPTGLSFPSAHAATAFAGAFAYSGLGVPRVPLYALASTLAYSRLYLGVHHPSDILAGAALGTALAAGLARLPAPGADQAGPQTP